MLKEFKRLKGKEVKIVYKETEGKDPYISEGRLVDASKSFVVVRASNGLVHFIGTQSIIRLSERFPPRKQVESEFNY